MAGPSMPRSVRRGATKDLGVHMELGTLDTERAGVLVWSFIWNLSLGHPLRPFKVLIPTNLNSEDE